jgi:hypothetical protein
VPPTQPPTVPPTQPPTDPPTEAPTAPPVVNYRQNPPIPDFGAMFGIQLHDFSTSNPDPNRYRSAEYYYYQRDQVSIGMVSEYTSKLVELGYPLIEHVDNMSFYGNNNILIGVLIGGLGEFVLIGIFEPR